MLKAIEFEILRGITANGRKRIPLERQPVRVATLLNEEAFNEDQHLIHNKTVFLEDRMHDWEWREGQFRYFTRIAETADVLVVYRIEDVVPQPRFDSMTGERLVPKK